MLESFRHWLGKQRYPLIVALGYLLIIFVGACLLRLPCASRIPGSIDMLTAFFTSTSATCVTGLIAADTWTTWTTFGQVVLLALIQIGGLGFMTVIVMIPLLLHQSIGLKARSILMESINVNTVGGAVKLFKRILLGTLIFEGTGAILLMLRFVPEMGARGVWYAVFHSISAFCNAGFDLFGSIAPYSSVTTFTGDYLVSGTLMALIIVGGLGFFVWNDVYTHKLRFRAYSLHTRVVLVTGLALTVGGAVLFLLTERGSAFAGMSLGERINTALFCSVTPRTAGFNMVDTETLSHAGRMLTDALMFIGGNPGSTAGGVKTTTIIVLLAALRWKLWHENDMRLYNRRIDAENVVNAATVMFTGMLLVAIATLLILIAQPEYLIEDVLFEALSAASTVGYSGGVTALANPFTKIILALLMYLGRVGSMSFALLFTAQSKPSATMLPLEKIPVG